MTSAPSSPSPSLEAVELELALQAEDPVASCFAESVRRAASAAGGIFLFEIRVDMLPGLQRMAAVGFGSAGERQVVMVAQPADGGAPRVEPLVAGTETNPLADLALSYAGVMDCLARETAGT
jgi:hypothetical protein